MVQCEQLFFILSDKRWFLELSLQVQKMIKQINGLKHYES